MNGLRGVKAITVLALCVGLGFRPAVASTVVVPDDSSTVSAAIASGADTVLVRAGTYTESPVLVASFRPIVLMADPAASPRPTLQGLIVRANHSYEGDRKVV